MSPPIVRLEIRTPDGFTRLAPVQKTPFVIGADADLRLAAKGVAARHARIVRVAGTWHLLPEPGLPLTLDGAAVPADGAPLGHGALIGLGPGCPLTLRFLVDGVRSADGGDRLVTLMEVARTITSSLALDEVVGRVLEGAVRFSGADRGYLFLRDGARLVPWTGGGGPPPSVEVSLSVAEQVARTGRPVYRDRLGDDAGRPLTASIARLRLQAILCLPLAVRADVIGVIYLDSRKPLPHHQPDLPLLEALAGLAAVAIQNSRLVEERVSAERTLAIGQMARAIVHDLRSPLTSIRGLAELLHERTPESDPARSHLGTIMAEADRLAGLVSDLLQFSRQAPPPQRAPAPLADIVRRTLLPLQSRLQQSGVRVALALEEGARVNVDAPRLIRALHNLVVNAIEAMERGGTLTIRCEAREGRWAVTVRDEGCGMNEEVRRRVFEPFFSHGKEHGTGLGMAIVRQIVEEHGGAVGVDSAPGRGTTISLTLPAAA